MEIINTVLGMREVINEWRVAGKTVAFVPTMGNLHAGHLHLVSRAKKSADHVVVSIFVNPTQFGVGEDFEAYPRTEREDQEKLESEGVDLLFLPSVADVYAPDAKTTITVTGISDSYCGAFRPGHFSGVATVVCKLFNIVQPTVALFGLKDFQQFAVIKLMVRDLNIPVEIVGVDTVRESSGLALSSRNGYLTQDERMNASALYVSLCDARDAILAGNQNYEDVEKKAMQSIQQAGFQVDYFSVCRTSDLKKANLDDTDLVLLVAAKLGKTRLIDNIYFSK
jgi:pantoate--beta-alanine ligase